MEFKIGDKVKWEGKYFHRYKDGMSKKEFNALFEKDDSLNALDYMEFKLKKGIGKIKSIEYFPLFKKPMITLYNKKLFDLKNNNLKLVK